MYCKLCCLQVIVLFKKHVAVSELVFGVDRQNRYESSTVDSVVTGRGAVLTNSPL